MTQAEALRIVLDLAVQNIIDPFDNEEEYSRQDEATEIVSEMLEAMS